MDLHLAMVEAWLTRETVPNGLQPERPWPDAVRRLRRELEARE
jgi:hypothetical protein